jgi:hypothetical protein
MYTGDVEWTRPGALLSKMPEVRKVGLSRKGGDDELKDDE